MNDPETILDLIDKVIGYADNQPLILNHLTVLRSRTEALIVDRDQLEADTKDQTLAKEIDRLSAALDEAREENERLRFEAFQESKTQEAKPKPPQERPPVVALTHAQIMQSIEAVPPFQQAEITNSFVGKRVSWAASLHSIGSILKDLPDAPYPIHVCCQLIEGRHRDHDQLFCWAAQTETGPLATVQRNDPIRVTGTIRSISGIGSTLEDCTFQPTPTNDG